jgi:hypothetical protein
MRAISTQKSKKAITHTGSTKQVVQETSQPKPAAQEATPKEKPVKDGVATEPDAVKALHDTQEATPEETSKESE